jgi:hypothetical protein
MWVEKDFMSKIEQDHDKDTYPKLILNKLNVMWDSTFIYFYWAPSLQKFFKKLSTYTWPTFTHVWLVSIHVKINTELWLN